MTSINQSRGFMMSSFISSLATSTFLALIFSQSTTLQTTAPASITGTSLSGEEFNITRTVESTDYTGVNLNTSENQLEVEPIEVRLDAPVNAEPIVIPTVTPISAVPLPKIIEQDGNEVIVPVIVPPEVKPIQDITSTIGTIRTTIDESQERIKTIVNDRIEGVLRDKGVVPTPENTAAFNALREDIVRDIGSSIATTTPPLPVNTKELKNKITENLKKIDKLMIEIEAKAPTMSSVKSNTEPRTGDEKLPRSASDRLATSTSSLTDTERLDRETDEEEQAKNATGTSIGVVMEEQKIPTPAEAAREVNRLIDRLAKTVTAQSKAFKEQGGEELFKDSNKDGISDYESVHLYGIDPTAPASVSVYEGKPITPEEKILLGFDPAKTELVKIAHEEPRGSPYITSAYTVEEMTLTPEKTVEIRGKALPNSFVTIYIYSTPIIVTVKTDGHGEWKYTLDKELEDGRHTMYTASVSNSGKILARSSPVLFVKTAEAAIIEEAFVATPTNTKPRVLGGREIFFIVIAVLGVILIAINIIGAKSKDVPSVPTT